MQRDILQGRMDAERNEVVRRDRMAVETKQDLMGLIRKEAAIAFDVRDAATKLAATADRLCRSIGTNAMKAEESRAATDAHIEARKNLGRQVDRLTDHMKAMNEAAK